MRYSRTRARGLSALVVVVAVVASSLAVGGPSPRPAAAAAQPASTTFQFRPDAPGLLLPGQIGEMSMDVAGNSIGTSAGFPVAFAATMDEEGDRGYFHAVADREDGVRSVQVLDAPGIVDGGSYTREGQISGDGMTYVGTYRAYGDSLGACSQDFGDPDAGAQYWSPQVIYWQRDTPTGEFDDPELATPALGATGCDGIPADEGPDLMGVGSQGGAGSPSVSEDGSVIAFTSAGRDLVATPPTNPDTWEPALYVSEDDGAGGRDVTLVTPVGLDGYVGDAMVSGDGNRIVFVSDATNLVTGVTIPPDSLQVYVATRETSPPGWSIELMSHDPMGVPADGAAMGDVSIDSVGERIVYTTWAGDLDPTASMPPSGSPVIVVQDVDTGDLQFVTDRQSPTGGQLHGQHLGYRARAVISWDGEQVAAMGDTGGGDTQLITVRADDALSTAQADRRDARLDAIQYQGGNEDTVAIGGAGPYLTGFTGDAPLRRFAGDPTAIYVVGQGGPGADAARGWHGDPVDTATGSFRQDEVDLTAPAGSGLATLDRSYTSVSEAAGIFGPGWMSTLDARLVFGEEVAVLELPNGQKVSYEDTGSGFVALDASRGILEDTVDGVVLTDPSGGSLVFDGSGRLIALRAPGQPEVVVTWGDLSPEAVTSASGYQVVLEDWRYEVQWDPVTDEPVLVTVAEPDGLVDRATTSDGRQVDYGYADPDTPMARLSTVSRPHAVGQPAGTFGTRTYEMDGSFLTRIVDRVDATRARVVVENGYDPEGRVVHQVTDTGDELEFAYGTRLDGMGNEVAALGFTTVSNLASGDRTVYEHNAAGEIIGMTDALGNESTSSWAIDRPATATSRSGVTTDHQMDAAGRIEEVTETVGATTRTVQSFTYVVPDTDPASLVDDRVATTTDEAGLTVTFTYDGSRREPATVSVPCDPVSVDPATPCPPSGLATTTYTYEPSGPAEGLVASTTDPDGVLTELTYGADRTVATSTTYDGATPLTTTYDTTRPGDVDWTETNPAAVEVRTVETPGGAVTTSVYDAEGRLIEVRDPLYDGVAHGATVHGYSLDGVLVSTTDPAGRVTTYAVARPGDPGWAEAAEVAEVRTATGPDGISEITKVDRSGDIVVEQRGDTAVPAELATTTHGYGPLGRRTSTTDPMGVTTEYEYDVEGRLVALVDEDDERTEVAYDAFGRVTVETDQRGETRTTTYDAAGRVTGMEDREGHDTTFAYDAAGRLLSTTDARGGVVSRTYTPGGRLASETDATARTTQYRYDSAGRRVEVELPSGATTTTTYDLDGQVASVTSPEGRVTAYTYDDLGRVLTAADPASGTTTTTYTAGGEVATRTDATGGMVTYAYDGAGRVETVTDPLGRVTAYEHDSRGNRTKRTDALAGEREWHWNLADQLVEEVDPLDRSTSYSYDALGRLAGKTDGAGRTEAYGYDAAGQLTSVTYASGAPTTFAYDGEGRRTQMVDATGTTSWAYNATGLITGVNNPGARDLAFAWDLAGRRTVIDYPDGSRYRNRYDTDGRLSEVEVDTAGTWVDVAVNAYDDDGQLVEQDQGASGLREWTYDAFTGRMTGYDETRGAVTTSTALTHDAAGRIASETTGGASTAYDYDAAGQLTLVDRSTGDDTTITYDELGRRDTLTTGTNVTTHQWDAASQLTRRVVNGANHNYQYDGSGRRTREAWNGGNRVIQLFWGARGNLGTQRYTEPGTVTDITRSTRGDGTLAGLTTVVNGVTTDTTSVVWDPTMPVPQPVWTGEPGAANAARAVYGPDLVRFTCPTGTSCTGPAKHDVHGSALRTTATSAVTVDNAYGPWGGGGPVFTTNLDYGYRSELHSGATVHLRAREYDPSTGLFLSPDPLAGVDGTTTVNNPYHYADNDPVNKTDPTGLRPSDRDAAQDCYDRGGNLWVPEPMAIDAEESPLQGCIAYDPCADEGIWGLRHVRNFGCDHQQGLLDILQFVGSFAAGSFCAILAGPAGWAAAGAAGGACGGMAYRYMSNARTDQGLLDGVFDPKAIARDAAIGVAFAGLARGAGVAWGRLRPGAAPRTDPGLSQRGFVPPAGTRIRPPGLPSSWRISNTHGVGGVQYSQPGNSHSWVRVMPGNLNSPYPISRAPYVRWQKNGAALDVDGNVVPKNSEAAHIPLEDFVFLTQLFGG